MEPGDLIAIFGREPTLSAWELCRLLSDQPFSVLTRELAIVPPTLQPQRLQMLAGGLVKVGVVEGQVASLADLEHELVHRWPELVPNGSTARIAFGGSVYDAGMPATRTMRRDLGVVLQRVKKAMVASGRSARVVVAKEPTLPASALVQGKILTQGFEVLLLATPTGLVWGRTADTQDIAAYGDRDFGRPARDSVSGMLPPKVAQVMVNLTQPKPNDRLLDPFCGSGTILQEALLLGISHVHGSDISPKAVADTTDNLAWLAKHFGVEPEMQDVVQRDAKDLPRELGPEAVDVIATEPYLGPPQRGVPRGRVILPLVSALSRQYEAWLRALGGVVRTGGRVAMVWPFFRVEEHGYFLQLQNAVGAAGFSVIAPPPWLIKQSWFRSTPRGSILYSRPDQVVGREIILLKKEK
ncbi:MAG: RsmD family RNA methyltransferase [Patescibacteria group bacterium]